MRENAMSDTIVPGRWARFRDSYLLYSFKRDLVAQLSLVLFAVLIIAAVFAPWLAPANPYDLAQIDILASELPPFWIDGADPQYLMGTDAQGRDLLSTILYGARVSLIIGFGAVLMQAAIGVSFGLMAGYLGGRVDAFLMRLADIQLSFSTLMVAIIVGALVKAIFGGATFSEYAVPLLVLIIGLAEWPQSPAPCAPRCWPSAARNTSMPLGSWA